MRKSGVYILLVVLIAAAAGGFVLWGRGMFPGTCEPKTRGEAVVAAVAVWNPEGSILTVKVSPRCSVSMKATPPETSIIIPVNKPGEKTDERVVVSPVLPWYRTAFCPGDSLELKLGGTLKAAEIGNAGARGCRLRQQL